MRRKMAVKLLLICFLGVGALAGIRMAEWWEKRQIPIPYIQRILGVAVVTDTDFLLNKERITCGQNPGVCFEEVLLPYDKAGILYLAQDMGDEWKGELSTSLNSFFLCMPSDAYWENKQDAMRENHSFIIWLVGEDCYYEMQMIVSGMPVISIQTARSEEQEDVDYDVDPDKKYFGSETQYYGTIDVFNPGVNTMTYEILQSHVRYYQKGASSYDLPKKSYSLCLQDYEEQNIDVSLLGMRMDNTWKLNALFSDPNRIREITAARIWEQFDAAEASINEMGPRMEYVELILDNCYQGLYCLVEPVDEKKLELDRNDILYKVLGWNIPLDEDIQFSVDKKWKIQSSIRIRYPKIITDYFTAWFPMRDYLNTFCREQQTSYEDMREKVDLANLSDMLLFTMVTSASDNSFKNTYYAAKVDTQNQYVMYQVPWDLDLTFGNQYSEMSFHSMFVPDYTVIYGETAILVLLENQPDEVGDYLMDKWERYRESFLSTESILNLFVSNRDYLLDTGAAIREQNRWPEGQVDMDITYLLEYQTKRMNWLDGYFGR